MVVLAAIILIAVAVVTGARRSVMEAMQRY